MQILQLGNTVYQKGYLRAEFLLNFFPGHNGILHHIMQKSCSNGFLIHLKVCQNDCDAQGMYNVRLSGLPYLILMCLVSHMVRLFNQGNVIGGVVFAHTQNKIPI